MFARISHRLINAHRYYIEQLYNERKTISDRQFDNNYYYQEFLIPTVSRMFNLTMQVYDTSNMEVDIGSIKENQIRGLIESGKQIFHAVKHDSKLLINTTEDETK